MDLAPLAGFTIGITADRRREEQAELLRRWGATVVSAPVIRTCPVRPDDHLRAVTEALVAGPPDIVVATTGIGIRGWLSAAEAWGCFDELLSSLRQARLVARGPKAAGALQAADLPVWRREPTERLDALVARLVTDGGLEGLRVAVQLYGDEAPWAVAALRAAGAHVFTLPVYRWSAPEDDQAVVRLVDMACDGDLDAVTFTSPPAVRLLMESARGRGRGDALVAALNDSVVACVGPVTAEAARREGIVAPVAPLRGRLGLLVRVVADELERRRVRLSTNGSDLVIQGSLVARGRERVALPRRERQLLRALAVSPGVVVSRARLLREVWGEDQDDHALETTVCRLRRRLGPVGMTIVAHPRRGYRVDRAP